MGGCKCQCKLRMKKYISKIEEYVNITVQCMGKLSQRLDEIGDLEDMNALQRWLVGGKSVARCSPSGGPWLFLIPRTHVRNINVSLQGALTPYITGPAVETASQRIGEADANRNGFDAQTLEHLDDA